MAEPLSALANFYGISVPALQRLRLLLNDLREIKDAPEAVENLKTDIMSVDMALTSLQAVEDQGWASLVGIVAYQSMVMISTCAQACNIFKTNLRRWTSRSQDGKLSWHNRANVGFFEQAAIKSMSEQLQNCKVTINLVVSIATLYGSIGHIHVTEEIKKTISMKRIEITSAVEATNEQLSGLGNRLEQLKQAGENQDEVEDTESKADALRQLEEACKALFESRKLLAELAAKAQEDAVAGFAAKNQSRLT